MGRRVRMVCDGVPPQGGGAHLPGIEVIYSGSGQSADEVIIATIDRSSAPSGITVVSSDRAIVAAARRRGARPIESGAFLSRLLTAAAHRGIERFQPKPLPALPLGDAEVGYWLKEFGQLAQATGTEAGTPANPAPKNQHRSLTNGSELRPSGSGTVRDAGSVAHGSRTRPPYPDTRTPVPDAPSPLGRSRLESDALAAHTHPLEAWITEARRMWPDLTIEDLMMEKWLNAPGDSKSKRKPR